MALAGPVLQTAARTAGYAGRTSRAVVALDGAGDSLAATIGDGAFASATFQRPEVADALSDAIRWLAQQPPSSREIVIAGTLRRGSIAESDLALIPQGVGVRFQNAAGSASDDLTWPVLARRDGVLVRIDRAVHVEVDATRVADGQAVAVPDDLVSIVAREADTDTGGGGTARRARCRRVRGQISSAATQIVWEGADAAAINRAGPGAQIIRMPVPAATVGRGGRGACGAARRIAPSRSVRAGDAHAGATLVVVAAAWFPAGQRAAQRRGRSSMAMGRRPRPAGNRSLDATRPFGDRISRR